MVGSRRDAVIARHRAFREHQRARLVAVGMRRSSVVRERRSTVGVSVRPTPAVRGSPRNLPVTAEAWNGVGESGVAWDGIHPHIERWARGSQEWARRLATQRDLASELAGNAEKQL